MNWVTICFQEEEVVSSTEDQLFRINSDFGFEVASKLGFANAKDLVSEDDLKIEVKSIFNGLK